MNILYSCDILFCFTSPEIQHATIATSIVVAIKSAPQFQRCLLRQCGGGYAKTMFFAIDEASDPSDVLKYNRQHNNHTKYNATLRHKRQHYIMMQEKWESGRGFLRGIFRELFFSTIFLVCGAMSFGGNLPNHFRRDKIVLDRLGGGRLLQEP